MLPQTTAYFRIKQLVLLAKYGLSDKFKSWLIWSGIWILLAVVLASLFDSFSGQTELDKVLETLPETLLSTVNISTGYFTKVESFVSGQFLTIYTLMGSIFAVFLGVGGIGGKIESGEITSQLNQNLNRFQIIFNQIIVNTIFLIASGVLVGCSSYLAFSLFTKQDEVSIQFFVMAMLGSFGLQFFGLALGFLSGLVFSKSIAQSVGGGVMAASWLFDGLSSTNGYPEFLKPLSVFYYFDVDLLIKDYTLNWSSFGLLIGLAALILITSIWQFSRKEISW